MSHCLSSARVALPVLLLVAAGTFGVAAPVAAAANNTTVDVQIGDCIIRGGGAPYRAKIHLEWRSADGTLREASTVDSQFGDWSNDINLCLSGGFGVQPGDTITTTIKGASRTFKVTPLTVRVDRNTDVVTGTTKPNSKLLVWLNGSGPGTAITWQRRDLHARPDGSYTVDFRTGDAADIRGWDRIDVAWADARGDYVRNWSIAPGVQVTIGQSWIEAAGQPGFNATLKLRQFAGGPVIARTGGIVYAKYNAFAWLDKTGEEVGPAEGNQVVTDLAADASFVVPALDMTVDKMRDVVRLHTGLGPDIGVYFEVLGTGGGSYANVDTDASGSVKVDFTGGGVQWFDIVRGSRITITVRLRTGDEVIKQIVVS